MLNTTLRYLKCPRTKGRSGSQCGGGLTLFAQQKQSLGKSQEIFEVRSGRLTCQKCQSSFPIVAGVAILVNDVRRYLMGHAKGIARNAADSDIPPEYVKEFRRCKGEIQQEHIEEDLEAERVNSLYLMNHYLRVASALRDADAGPFWWQSLTGELSPWVDSLVREYWDQGPFAQIEKWVKLLINELSKENFDVLELGCGVGGLFRALMSHVHSYLGVDSSFASIALARHLALSVPYSGDLRIPEDLLYGPVSRKVDILPLQTPRGQVDFVVAELESLPLRAKQWNLSIALNAIDMLEDPGVLPMIQRESLRAGGVAIQSSPYIWHAQVAKRLKSKLPKEIKGSAQAVEWLYRKAGFEIQKKIEHQPWLFFKNVRQVELYSVHLFLARQLGS